MIKYAQQNLLIVVAIMICMHHVHAAAERFGLRPSRQYKTMSKRNLEFKLHKQNLESELETIQKTKKSIIELQQEGLFCNCCGREITNKDMQDICACAAVTASTMIGFHLASDADCFCGIPRFLAVCTFGVMSGKVADYFLGPDVAEYDEKIVVLENQIEEEEKKE